MARYKIVLEDVAIEMFLGIHDFEKRAMQRVIISARIETPDVDWRAGDYFDYDGVTEFIRGLNGARIETQEELVERIHGFIMQMGAEQAEVYSRKPDVYPDAKSVGLIYRG